MSQNDHQIFRGLVERTKLSQKVLSIFAIFTIVTKILIIKNRRILIFNNFLLIINFTKKQQMTKIVYFLLIKFWEFFQNFLVPLFLMLVKIVANKKMQY